MRHSVSCLLALAAVACAPSLTPPGEAIRVSGTVRDEVAAPVEIEVYERCSARFYLFESCPGKHLGRARIPKPGKFLVAVDTGAPELSVVAFRGIVPGQEEACAVRHLPAARSPDPVELDLTSGPCPIQRPEPITASARAPVSGY
jgi:hypothetical protein